MKQFLGIVFIGCFLYLAYELFQVSFIRPVIQDAVEIPGTSTFGKLCISMGMLMYSALIGLAVCYAFKVQQVPPRCVPVAFIFMGILFFLHIIMETTSVNGLLALIPFIGFAGWLTVMKNYASD